MRRLVALGLVLAAALAPTAHSGAGDAADVRAGGLPCFLSQYLLCGFAPAELAVAPGTVVRWTNDDTVLPAPHTVSSADGLFESGHMGPGGTFEFRFLFPGTYDYACMYHGQMQGRVTVS